MFAEISAALTSARTLTEIVRGINAFKQEGDLNVLRVEMTNAIIDIQTRLLAASEVIDDLNKQIRDLEGKVEAKQKLEDFERYSLPSTGVTVYRLRQEKSQPGAEPYYFCTRCMERDHLVSTLQAERGDHYLRCSCCDRNYQAVPDQIRNRAASTDWEPI